MCYRDLQARLAWKLDLTKSLYRRGYDRNQVIALYQGGMYQLYSHPFSSYSQKVLIALYENATPFEYRNLEDPVAIAVHEQGLGRAVQRDPQRLAGGQRTGVSVDQAAELVPDHEAVEGVATAEPRGRVRRHARCTASRRRRRSR